MAGKRRNHEGTIYKTKHGTYRNQVMVNGKRYSKNFNTVRAAQKWANKINHDVYAGFTEYSDVSVGEYMNSWYELYSPTLQYATRQSYQRSIKHYINPYIGHLPIRKLTPLKVDQFYYFLHKSENKSPNTIRETHIVLHCAFEYGVKKRFLAINPAHGATRPPVNKSSRQVLNPPEIRQFISASQNTVYGMLYYMAIKTGMRQSELFALEWNHINWSQQTLNVRQQKSKDPSILVTPYLKSSRAYRTLRLSNKTIKRLKEHQAEVESQSQNPSKNWRENNWIFPTSVGTMYDSANVLKKMKSILKKEKLPEITFHDLRHTIASIMINDGIPIPEVSRLLGHHSISFTLDTYIHFIPSMHTDNANKIEETLNLEE